MRAVSALLAVVPFVVGALMGVFSRLTGEPIENLNTAVRGIGLLLMAAFVNIVGIAGDR